MIAEIKRDELQITKRETEHGKQAMKTWNLIRLNDVKGMNNAAAVCDALTEFRHELGRWSA